MKKKTEHVRVKNMPDGTYLMFCEHCGARADTVIQPPISVNVMVAMLKAYTKDHKSCQPAPEVAPG